MVIRLYILIILVMSFAPTSRLTQKRLQGDLKLLKKDPHPYVDAYPDEKNNLIWYFLVKGLDFTDYIGGWYIGKIMLPHDYPVKPPDFVMLTPNGRFDIEKKICLSNSGYHSDEWSSMWNMKAILTGFLSIMADDNDSGISHIKRSSEERKIFSKKSVEYNMHYMKDIWTGFTRFVNLDGSPKSDEDLLQDLKISQSLKKKCVVNGNNNSAT